MFSTGLVRLIHMLFSRVILTIDEIKHVISLRLYLLTRALWRPAQFVLLLIWTRFDFISFVCFWCLRKQHSLRKEVVIIQESNGLPLSERQQIGFSVTQTSWKHEEKDKTKGYFWGSCLSTLSHRSVRKLRFTSFQLYFTSVYILLIHILNQLLLYFQHAFYSFFGNTLQ